MTPHRADPPAGDSGLSLSTLESATSPRDDIPTMPLDDENRDDARPAWYADGLHFKCAGCGNCCTGGPGYVWISQVELGRLAEYLGEGVEAVLEKYCRNIGATFGLKEKPRNARGEYDCIFLNEEESTVSSGGEMVKHRKRTCSIYEVRPLQCRTWPFWHGLLTNAKTWDQAAKGCAGINAGELRRLPHILARRNATDWPE